MKKSFNFFPPVIAHRGASAYAPENTLIAFTKAAQRGIRWIECDVMLAGDGEPIIFHDETLERTTNGRGLVADYSYAYLRTLDAGSWYHPMYTGEAIPTLEQLLYFLSEMSLSVNLDIKSLVGQEAEIAEHVLRVIQKMSTYISLPMLLLSSFQPEVLYYCRQQCADVALGLLLENWPTDVWSIVQETACVSMHLDYSLVEPDRITAMKQRNLLVLCYTVNDRKQAQKLYADGVDAIISDVPDRICSVT